MSPLCSECGGYYSLPDRDLCDQCHARQLNPGTLPPIDPNDKDPWF